MKCINCGTDNNLKDRTESNGRCKDCNHPFAFEPQNMEQKLRFTDPFFANAIAQLSNDNTLYFTPKQFRYFLNQKIRRQKVSLFRLVFFTCLLHLCSRFFLEMF